MPYDLKEELDRVRAAIQTAQDNGGVLTVEENGTRITTDLDSLYKREAQLEAKVVRRYAPRRVQAC